MKLSIIIPTLNEEKILEKTLKSLRLLNAIDYEVIISDGHSTDRTVEIAKKYADKVIEHDGSFRQNIAQGKNDGAQKAIGDYLLFLDADVIIPDTNSFFIKAFEIFEKDKRLVALTVFLKVLPEHVTLSDKFFFGMVNLQTLFFNNVMHMGVAAGEFQMMTSSAFKNAGGYNPALVMGEDAEFFNKLSKLGKVRTASGLEVFHTSRRAHSIGWPKLLFLWWFNFLFARVFKRSHVKEWTVIR
jgi:glycosyltransferase involved in cell wall biosynthesis